MHLSLSLGNISFPRYEGSSTLADLNPYAVYAATDVMLTGEPIVQIRRASDDATQDMTEAEFYGSTYDTFISGTTGHISKIYNQVSGADSATDLIQESEIYQPSRGTGSGGSALRAFDFSADFMYSGDISALSDRPDFDGDITMGSAYVFRIVSSQSYVSPLFTYYNSNTGGTSFNYVPVHGAAHRQLTAQISGSTPPVEKVDADDFGTSIKTAEVSLTPATTTMKSAVSVHSSETYRRVFATGMGNAENTDDCGTITEPSTTAFGIGGWKAGGVSRSMTPTMNIACSCIFDRSLSLDDQTALYNILEGLRV